jgi:hypothetical protein
VVKYTQIGELKERIRDHFSAYIKPSLPEADPEGA